MDKATVTGLLRKRFYPLLKQDGFVRQGDVARRVSGPVVHVTEVAHSPRRGVFYVRLGAHVTTLGRWASGPTGKPLDASAVREATCAWRASVKTYLANDHSDDWPYCETTEQAVDMVEFLVCEWPRQSVEFFGPLSDWPAGFLALAAQAVDDPEHFPLPSGYAAHPAHRLTWALTAALAGDPELARRIALAALPSVPLGASDLRDKLALVADDPATALDALADVQAIRPCGEKGAGPLVPKVAS
jgi:hypothetical protein